MSETNGQAIENPWDSVGADPDLAKDGIWIDDFIMPGWRIRIRSAGSMIAKRRQDKQFRDLRSVITTNNGMVPAELRDRMEAELCTVLVVDWQNIPDPANPAHMLPCNPDTIKSIASHPKYGQVFRTEVTSVANQQSFFRADVLADIAKN